MQNKFTQSKVKQFRNDFQNAVLELEKNNIDLCEWEYVEYLIENNKEGQIILNKNEIDNNIVYNVLYIKGDKFSIKKEIQQRFF